MKMHGPMNIKIIGILNVHRWHDVRGYRISLSL